MGDNKTNGGMSTYIDATKKANEAKMGLMVNKKIRQLPKNGGKQASTTVTVTSGKRIEPTKEASELGWKSTADMIEETDSKHTETRQLQPATVDEVFK